MSTESEQKKDDSSDAEKHFEKAKEIYENGSSDKALKEVEKAISINPEVSKFWLLKGDINIDLWKLDESLRSYDEAISIDPKLVSAWNKKGEVYMYKSKHLFKLPRLYYDGCLKEGPIMEELIDVFKEEGYEVEEDAELTRNNDLWWIIENGEKNYKIEDNTVINIYKSELDKALKCLDKSLSLNEDNPRTWTIKGSVHKLKGEIEKGIECYDKAISIDPSWSYAWINKGHAYRWKTGEFDKALECYKRAISINPDHAKFLM